MPSTVRKRGGNNTTEGPTIYTIDGVEGADDDDDDDVKISDDQPDKMLWTLMTIVFILFLYKFTVPNSTKLSHKKAIEQQLDNIANRIEDQHKALATRYESFSSQLNEKLGKFSKLEDEVNSEKMEIDDEEETSYLQQKLDVSEANAAKLQDEIAKLQGEMEKLKEEMEFDQSTFCGDCTGNFLAGKLQVKCSERRDWLMEQFEHSKEVATEAIEKIDPDNCKKHHQDPSDHAVFCEECVGEFFSNNLRIRCGKRRDYLMNRHGDSKEHATEAVMSMDPVNCVKNN